uniref:Uncharacterized protein n=1 Tax=Avena sativa TaxID=4498 RepID=A0ACD5WSU8_AVESA
MDHEVGTNALERLLHDGSAEPTDLPLSLLEDITKCFADDHQIGSGGFAVVYKGMVRNGIVAVKRLSRTFDMHEIKFHKEVECLMKAKHKNIVRFLGYCSDTQGKVLDYEGKMVMADVRNWLLCFEYVPNGSLDKYISDSSHGLDWRDRYQIIKGICEGLCHLHEKRILHLDLKPANILVDNHMVPKITDFGLSRCLDVKQTRAFTSNLCGSQGYLAPEFYSGQVAFASDIYSLGVIILEILTGQKGYSDDENVIENWAKQLETSDHGDTLLEQVRVCTKMGIECMDLDPKRRPVLRDIVDRLDKTESGGYSEETAMTLPAHSGGGWRVWNTEWWDRLSDQACPEAEFRKAFRMSRATFDALCDELSLSSAVGKEETMLYAAIPLHQRVAVCLWHLATGEPLCEVSSHFGIRISTCHNIVLEVCAAIATVLLPKAVRWPLDLSVIASRFEALSGIPRIVGAVCTHHIPIHPPKENASEYYNHRLTEHNNKASYSIAVQAVVDGNGMFTDISIGLPGSLSDADVLERSVLHAHCVAGLLAHNQYRLVGSARYPLKDWMLVPYSNHDLTWTQHAFNDRISVARTASRGAFQRLKAQWGCLGRCNEHRVPHLLNMIGACCALHNFCERSGEKLDTDVQFFSEDDVVAVAEKERDRIAHDLLWSAHVVYGRLFF